MQGQIVSTQLDTVTITASANASYSLGFKIQKIDSLLIHRYQIGTMADLLSASSTLGIKTYGAGRLATSSLRGMSAIHTAVLWNGININQPNLGQSDLSNIPILSFDQVFVQYGAAGSLLGSGAVGGSIMLQSVPTWTKKWSHGIFLSIDSFANKIAKITSTGGFVFKEGSEIACKVGLLASNTLNHYPNTSRLNVQIGQNTVSQKGLHADIYLKTIHHTLWTLHLFWSNTDLIIEPNYDAARQFSEQARLVLNYNKKKLEVKLALLSDKLDYYPTTKTNSLLASKALNYRWIARVEQELNLWKGASLKTGIDYSYWITNVDNYGNKAITEHRMDLYSLAKQSLGFFAISATLRQSLVQGYNPPLSPAIGSEALIFQSKKNQLAIKSNIAKNYRVPTLNERYWLVLGNINLKPENGLNKEIGLVWVKTYAHIKNEIGVNYYHNLVDDWVYWNPEKNYKVENIQQVKATGFEVYCKITGKLNDHSFNLYTQYSLTKSTQEKAYSSFSNDLIGKQLIYVPVHQGVFNLSYQHKKTTFTLQNQWIGKRFIDFDNQQYLAGFALINTQLAYQSKFKKVGYQVLLHTNNLTNTFFLNVERKAMPGRSFNLSWVIQL